MNEMERKKESTPGENLAKQIIEQYNPKSVADMQNALHFCLWLPCQSTYLAMTYQVPFDSFLNTGTIFHLPCCKFVHKSNLC